MLPAARDAPSTAPGLAGGTRLWLAGLGALFMVLAAIASFAAIAEQTAFSEYLTQARRCVELNDCPTRGGRTGALPIFHGMLWIRLLAYSLQPGNDQTTIQTIILVMWLVSIPAMFLFLRRYVGLRGTVLAMGLYFQVILVGTDIATFTYTNLLPLPFVVYYAGIALLIETRNAIWGAIASLALAIAVSAELGSIVLVPFHILVVALMAARPWTAVPLCGLAFAVPFALESTDAALEIVRVMPSWRFAAGLAISVAMMGLAMRISRRLLRAAASAPERVYVVMAGALVYAAFSIWVACTLLMNNAPGPRYFLPASFPFLFVLARRLDGLGRTATLVVAGIELLSLLLLPFTPFALLVLQVPVFVVVTLCAIAELGRLARGRPAPAGGAWVPITVGACAIVLSIGELSVNAQRGDPQTLTMAEGERLVPMLYRQGFTYPELLLALQGPSVDDLMSLVTEHDPQAFTQPTQHLVQPSASVLVLKVPGEVAERTANVIASVPASDSRAVIAVRGEPSYLDWARARRCGWRSDGDGGGAVRCETPVIDQPLPHNWPYVRYGTPTSEPTIGEDHASERILRYEVPVRTPGRGRAHILRTANEWPSTWRIVEVRGVDFEGTLPGQEVRLTDNSAAAGVIVFELDRAIPGDPPWVWTPHLIEVTPENEHLLESFRAN